MVVDRENTVLVRNHEHNFELSAFVWLSDHHFISHKKSKGREACRSLSNVGVSDLGLSFHLFMLQRLMATERAQLTNGQGAQDIDSPLFSREKIHTYDKISRCLLRPYCFPHCTCCADNVSSPYFKADLEQKVAGNSEGKKSSRNYG